MHHVRPCIQSIFQHSDVAFHLYLLDDGSDHFTQSAVETLLAMYPPEQYTYSQNKENVGYLQTVNRGAQMGSSPYVITLNSDTVVTPGWLSGLVQPLQADPTVGIVNPVSCWANWTLIPFPSGMDIHELAAFVKQHGHQKCKPLYNASGFCFAIRRDLLAETGWFDKAYDRGYYEETDICMKALMLDYQVVVVPSVFVYHHGWGSFQQGGRNAYMERNRSIFFRRHQKLFRRVERLYRLKRPLRHLRQALDRYEADFYPLRPRHRFVRLSQKYPLTSLAKTWFKRFSNRWFGTDFYEPLRGKQDVIETQSPHSMDIVAFSPVDRAQLQGSKSNRTIASFPKHSQALCYVLPANVAGSTKESVCELVNQMVLDKVPAKLVAVGSDDIDLFKGYAFYFRPAMYKDPMDGLRHLGACQVVVCHWSLLPMMEEWKLTYPSSALFVLVDTTHPRVIKQLHSISHSFAQTTGIVVPYDSMKATLSSFHPNVLHLPWGLHNDRFYAKSSKSHEPFSVLIPWVQEQATVLTALVQHLQTTFPTLQIKLYGEPVTSSCERLSDLYTDAFGLPNQREKTFRTTNVWLSHCFDETYLAHAQEAYACGVLPLLPRKAAEELFGSDWAQKMPPDEPTPQEWSNALSDFVEKGSTTHHDEAFQGTQQASQTPQLAETVTKWVQQLTTMEPSR